VAADSAGNVLVADSYNESIRRLTTAGVVSTFAGQGAQTGTTDGVGSAARFYGPGGAAVDASGIVYVADTTNDTIRKVTLGGTVTTLATAFQGPTGVTADGAGSVYVANRARFTIEKVTQSGAKSVLAGNPGTRGFADGTGTGATFDNPAGVAVDASGNVFVADSYNNIIRKVTQSGVVTTLAGSPNQGQSGADGTGSAARFWGPIAVALDATGNIYVTDRENHTLRKVTQAGVVTTVAGVAGTFGATDGTGTAARFNRPSGLCVDAAGNVLVADSGNAAIRKVTPTGVVTTVAGVLGQGGTVPGPLPASLSLMQRDGTSWASVACVPTTGGLIVTVADAVLLVSF
jgi:hypothetical protein